MGRPKRHELLKDICVTLGVVLERYLPGFLDGKKIEIVNEPPSEEVLAKTLRKKKSILVSVCPIDAKRSTRVQSQNQPIVHEEDEEGNLVEYRCGPPTYIESRFLVTPWVSGALEAQVVLGAIMQHFNSYSEVLEEDIQGDSIQLDDKPAFEQDLEFTVAELIKLWDAFKVPYRPSLVYRVTVRMESIRRTAIRRVRERRNVYRKLEG